MLGCVHESGGSHRRQIPLELELHICDLSVGTKNQTPVLCKSRASFDHWHISMALFV